MNKVLILGASGATGRLLVADCLARGVEVVAIVRAASSLQAAFDNFPNYREITASISEMSDGELSPLLQDCDCVVSCLGHNLNFKGLFGEPKRLVTDAIEKVTRVIESLDSIDKVKVILMNTSGNSNRDIPEQPPVSQRLVVALIRAIIPPHVDNEKAADFLRLSVGQAHPKIEWAAVRPDSLTDEKQVTGYKTYPSPIRNAIFDAGASSRINVAHFMADLATDAELWDRWKGQMPVLYNDV